MLVYDLIDNAPLNGEIRKPLMSKIAQQFNKQMSDTLIKK
jgi:hypothetical protein